MECGYKKKLDDGRILLLWPTKMGRLWYHWCIIDSDGFTFSNTETAKSRLPREFVFNEWEVADIDPVDKNPFESINKERCKEKHAEHLYIIQSEIGGPVKIGRSSDPHSRAMDLQIGSPFKLLVVRTYQNMGKYESTIHEALSEIRLHGEWFQECALSFVDDYVASKNRSMKCQG